MNWSDSSIYKDVMFFRRFTFHNRDCFTQRCDIFTHERSIAHQMSHREWHDIKEYKIVFQPLLV